LLGFGFCFFVVFCCCSGFVGCCFFVDWYFWYCGFGLMYGYYGGCYGLFLGVVFFYVNLLGWVWGLALYVSLVVGLLLFFVVIGEVSRWVGNCYSFLFSVFS